MAPSTYAETAAPIFNGIVQGLERVQVPIQEAEDWGCSRLVSKSSTVSVLWHWAAVLPNVTLFLAKLNQTKQQTPSMEKQKCYPGG